MESAPRALAKTTVVGQCGEALVAQWLVQQGWTVVARGWRSRWGELDIVAIYHSPDSLLSLCGSEDTSCPQLG
jgi:hypothetical protein